MTRDTGRSASRVRSQRVSLEPASRKTATPRLGAPSSRVGGGTLAGWLLVVIVIIIIIIVFAVIGAGSLLRGRR